MLGAAVVLLLSAGSAKGKSNYNTCRTCGVLPPAFDRNNSNDTVKRTKRSLGEEKKDRIQYLCMSTRNTGNTSASINLKRIILNVHSQISNHENKVFHFSFRISQQTKKQNGRICILCQAVNENYPEIGK